MLADSFIGCWHDGVYVAVSTGSSFRPAQRWSPSFGFWTEGWRGKDHPRFVADVNGGAVLDSDVRLGGGSTLICPDYVDVAVAVRHKNPNAVAPSVPNAVIVERYDVRYFRSDTTGVEGIDVPYRVSGLITTGVDVAEFLLAGASAVEVGTATFADPRAPGRILTEFRDWCEGHGVATVEELIGAAHG